MEYLRKLFVGAKVVISESLNERTKKSTVFLMLMFLLSAAAPAFGAPEGQPIDLVHSTMTVYVYKTGLLSGLAHNHEIKAPIAWGEVKSSEDLSVELRVDSSKLRVLDTEFSGDTRAKIQATVLSAEVLDVAHFPEIHFQSTEVEPSGTGHWVIHGNLELHGQTHPISLEVTLKDGSYEATAVLKQSSFGIKPVRVAGGTVKIKDEIKLAFSIALLEKV
jgi:polyisoprenoid-binding protein YceI